MSYEQTLAHARVWLGESAVAAELASAPGARTRTMLIWRRRLAQLVLLAMACSIAWWEILDILLHEPRLAAAYTLTDSLWFAVTKSGIHACLCLLSLWATRGRDVGGHLFARVVLVYLLLNEHGWTYHPLDDVAFFEAVVTRFAGGGLALALLGLDGIDSEDGRFQPIAYRRSLLVAITLSWWLALDGGMRFFSWARWGLDRLEVFSWVSLLAVALFAIAATGLSRLKFWGLLANGAGLLTLFAQLGWVILTYWNAVGVDALPDPAVGLRLGLQAAVVTPLLLVIARNQLRPGNHR